MTALIISGFIRWGSVEYGGNTTGQIAGGRWKPLHHLFRSSIFADQFATCNPLGACFVKNDGPRPMELLVRHCPSLTFHCLSTALPWLSPSFSLPFLDCSLSFHCLQVTMELINAMTGDSTVVTAHQASMAAGAGAVEWCVVECHPQCRTQQLLAR